MEIFITREHLPVDTCKDDVRGVFYEAVVAFLVVPITLDIQVIIKRVKRAMDYIKVAINEEPYLEGNTGDMIFGIAELIVYISAIKTLQPGDLIITGSPKGLGRHTAPIRFLNPGDHITITIDPIGELTNPVLEESRPNAKNL